MIKIGISSMLARYSFELVDETLYNTELKFKTKEVSTTVEGNLDIRVKLR